MKPALANLLVDPAQLQPMLISATQLEGDDIVTGDLRAEDGNIYHVRNGIPRLVLTQDSNQIQTSNAFAFKWKKRETYDSGATKQNVLKWCVEKYGFESTAEWSKFYACRQLILDVGCGSGFSSSLWLNSPVWCGRAMWVGTDISTAIDVAYERLGQVLNTHFVQADALQLPFRDGCFDTVFSEGVLHHTPSTRSALISSARVLASGGQFHFYVYRRKGPVREFTDDHIREKIQPLSDEEAWDAMRGLTELARVLCEAEITIEVNTDIPLLGIKAGRHDVHRLIYWSFVKLYWNSALSFEENVHVNFDWYRPRYAHRQSAEEVRQWCEEARLKILWFNEQESGYTVRARKI